jgi:hypothetical protein
MTIWKIKCWPWAKLLRKYAVMPTTIADDAQVRKWQAASKLRVSPEETMFAGGESLEKLTNRLEMERKRNWQSLLYWRVTVSVMGECRN